MSAEATFLAFDLGAESGRAVVANVGSGRVQFEEVHRFANGPVRIGEHLHWDVLRLLEEIKRGLVLGGRRASHALDSIGLCTWGVDSALLDREGELLGNPYCYRDPRNGPMMDKVFARISKEEIFERTGIQFMQLNALYSLYADRLLKPAFLAAAGTVLMIPDLFNYWLTGRRASELTIASTGQFLEAREDAWCRLIFDRLELPQEILPPLIAAGTALGPLQPAIVEEVGLQGIPVVAVAGHDTASAAAAVPSATEETFFISSGTWSGMGADVTRPVITPGTLRDNFTNERAVGGHYMLRKNIMGLWLLQESRRTWAEAGQDYDYPTLTRMAAQARPFGPMVEVDHETFLAPGDMPARIRAFCANTGQRPPDGPGDFARCIFESLALKYRWVLERTEEALGKRAGALHIVGGGSRNALLNQLTANAIGRPVLAGPAEATVLGNILVQAMARGVVSSLAEGRDLIRRSYDVVTYEPQERDRWDEQYARFVDLKGKSSTLL